MLKWWNTYDNVNNIKLIIIINYTNNPIKINNNNHNNNIIISNYYLQFVCSKLYISKLSKFTIRIWIYMVDSSYFNII